jgi:hypothetical protein
VLYSTQLKAAQNLVSGSNQNTKQYLDDLI